MNHFELFGLPESPAVDKSQLNAIYIKLQRELHPDYHTMASEQARADMEQKAAQVNQAMQIFKDRSKTLGYFLRLKGFSEDKDSVNLPAEFLMEMMEMNESLDDGDLESCKKRLMQWEDEMDIEFDSFVEGWRKNPNESILYSMKIHYLKQKYIQRMLERLGND